MLIRDVNTLPEVPRATLGLSGNVSEDHHRTTRCRRAQITTSLVGTWRT